MKIEDFETKFWEWFDSLDPKTKAKYFYFPLDLAKVYFENKIWKQLGK
jgi:hypothetical protein